MPVFDGVTGSGANTEFTIVGFISLKVSAYCLSHNKAGMKGNVNPPATPECKNANDRWIRGTFVRYVDIGAEMGGPDYGSTTVKLTD